jgi:hypothetical protein
VIERQWQAYVERLRAEPGLVITQSEARGDKFFLSGLRDPLAVDPLQFLDEAGIDPARVVAHFEPNQALDPQFVLARLQVRTTFFSLRVFICSIFSNSFGAMNGPFFSDRDIFSSLFLASIPYAPLAALARRLTPVAHNVQISFLIPAGLITQGGFTPRALRTRHTHRLAAFTTTMRVIARAHCCTTNSGTNTHVALAASFTQFHIAVIQVANLPNRRIAGLPHQANFARGQANLSVIAFFCQELSSAASRANQLSAATVFELNVMDQGTNGDIGQRQVVSRADLSLCAGDERIAHLYSQWGHDIAFFAISVEQQGQASGAVRIVFDRRDLRRYADFFTLEIDQANGAPVPTAAMADGDTTVRIPPTALAQRRN